MRLDVKTLMANLNHRPIAFYPVYAQLAGSINAGLLLSQLLYWHSAVNGCEFYKNDIEISAETYLSEKELRNAKARLKSLPFVKVTLRGMPAVTYYDFDLEQLAEAISGLVTPIGRIKLRPKGGTSYAQRAELDTPKGRNMLRPKGVLYTEITTENTTKTTTEINFPKTEKNDTTTKPKKPKNLQKSPARESGLDCLTDPVFISEMEAWTNGIINASYELDKMRDWLASSGKKYKDYRAFARNWIRRACEAAKKDWEAKQPKQVALNRVEVDEVMEHLRRNEEERRRMGLM